MESPATEPSSTRQRSTGRPRCSWPGPSGRGLFRLQRIKLYLIAYLIYRFLTEFIRPEPVVALGLTAYQWEPWP